MSSERRDLQGLTVVTSSGHEAVCPKGGFVLDSGLLEVSFRYRTLPPLAVVVPGNADEATIKAAMKVMAEARDEELDWQALAGELVGQEL